MSLNWSSQQLHLLPEIKKHKRSSSGSLFDQFLLFHEVNPEILIILERISLDLVQQGWNKGSINLIFERVRWIYAIQTQGDKYKLNNNHRAFYARLLMMLNSKLEGFFSIRHQNSERDVFQNLRLERMCEQERNRREWSRVRAD
jgi:hypothetical protein